MVTHAAEVGHESVGTINLVGARGRALPLLSPRDVCLVSSFVDQSKFFIRRPQGAAGHETQGPSSSEMETGGPQQAFPFSLLLQETILVTRDAGRRGRAASRQGRAGLPQQASTAAPVALADPANPAGVQAAGQRPAAAAGDFEGSTTAPPRTKTDRGSGGGPKSALKFRMRSWDKNGTWI